MVQQRGLFNDPAPEINALVHDIKQELQDLNSELDASQVRNQIKGANLIRTMKRLHTVTGILQKSIRCHMPPPPPLSRVS